MRILPSLVLASLVAISLVARGAPSADPGASITAFEKSFNEALAHNDVAALQRLLADDWAIVSGDGSVISRDRFLAVIGSGDLKHTAMTSSAPSIRVYGTTALFTAQAKSRGSYKGVAFETNEIGTDVLVKRQGRWVCVLTQLTTVAK
jgi:ketosteroid isomerase-like protein